MIRVLMVADGGVTTGFERVARGIGETLQGSGQFEVIQRGIGYAGTLKGVAPYPYELKSAYQSSEDPLGVTAVPRWQKEDKPDVVLLIQDIWHQSDYLGFLKPGTPVVGYYPVDTPNLKWNYGLAIAALTDAVPYTTFGAHESALAVRELVDVVCGVQGEETRGRQAKSLTLPKDGREIAITLPNLAGRQNLDGYRPIPHGVDVTRFGPGDKQAAREAWSLPANAFIVLNVNTNQFRKRLDTTIRAFAQFARDVPDAVLVLHCMGLGKDGWDLPQLARLYGVSDRVYLTHLVRPFATDDEVRALYTAADVQLNTGGGEGWGLCVGATTLVPTARGLLPIAEVRPGDRVVNEDAQWSLVKATVERTVRRWLEVRLVGHETVQVTPEHPFLTVRANLFDDPEAAARATWTPVGNLVVGDFVAVGTAPSGDMPVIDLAEMLSGEWVMEGDEVWHPSGYTPAGTTTSIATLVATTGHGKKVVEKALAVCKGRRTLGVSAAVAEVVALLRRTNPTLAEPARYCRRVTLDEDMCWAIGWYLAEGSGDYASVEFSMHEDEWEVAEALARVVTTRIGGTAKVSRSSSARGIRLSVSGRPVAAFFEHMCGTGAAGKRLHASVPLSNPLLLDVWRGYVQGDGHTLASGAATVTTTSRVLAHQLQLSMYSLGHKVSIRDPYKGRTTRALATHCVSLSVAAVAGLYRRPPADAYRTQPRCVVAGGKVWVRVRTLTEVEGTLNVHDLALEGTHSFVGNGVLVHNTTVEGALCGTAQMVPDWSATREIWAGHAELLQVTDYRFEKLINTAHAIVGAAETAARLRFLYDNPDALARVGAACRSRALQLPAWAEVGTEFGRRLRGALEQGPGETLSLDGVRQRRHGELTSELLTRDVVA